MEVTKEKETTETTGAYGQKLTIYHPNASGSGAALQIEPRFNREAADHYNCFFLDMAAQKTAPSRKEGKTVPATFDWQHKMTVKLGFADICELLAVLEGRQPKAGGQRNGLYHGNNGGSTVIVFERPADKEGIHVGLSRKSSADQQPQRVSLLLNETECVGLRSILQTGLFFVLFYTHIFGRQRQ